MHSLIMLALMLPTAGPKVTVIGALRPIMHQDQRAGVASLANQGVGPTTIGLGVAGELDGEITIIDGKTLIDRVREGRVLRDSDPGKGSAALLAYSHVSKWHEIVASSPISAENTDSRIESMIESLHLDSDDRIPIKIVGTFTKVYAHIIDGTKVPRGVSTHEIHKNSGIKIENTTETGTVVGFFSKKDAGVLTHHSTWTHFHISCSDKIFAGHVDSLQIEAKSKIFIGDLP